VRHDESAEIEAKTSRDMQTRPKGRLPTNERLFGTKGLTAGEQTIGWDENSNCRGTNDWLGL